MRKSISRESRCSMAWICRAYRRKGSPARPWGLARALNRAEQREAKGGSEVVGQSAFEQDGEKLRIARIRRK